MRSDKGEKVDQICNLCHHQTRNVSKSKRAPLVMGMVRQPTRDILSPSHPHN